MSSSPGAITPAFSRAGRGSHIPVPGLRTLYILRHAKSDRPAGVADFDRPLAVRGVRESRVMGDHLRAADIRPELVLSSPARRVAETVALVVPEAEVQLDDDLYGADGPELLARLHQVDGAVASVMVVGHNPGLHDLALSLASGDEPAFADLRRKFPTSALATLTFDDPWADLAPGGATLTAVFAAR
jgi:phosphohistidine phosphatase